MSKVYRKHIYSYKKCSSNSCAKTKAKNLKQKYNFIIYFRKNLTMNYGSLKIKIILLKVL